MVVCLPLAAAIHELGHWLAARLVGFRPMSIHLGFGPLLFRWRWNELDINIYAMPFTGASACVLAPGRLRRAVYVLGGLSANLAVLGATWPRLQLFDQAISPLSALAAANLIQALATLTPVSYYNDGQRGRLGWEAYALWKALTTDAVVLASARQMMLFHRYLEDCERRRREWARRTLDRLAQIQPGEVMHQVLQANLELWCGHYAIFLERGPALLELDIPEVERACIHGNLAWAHLYHHQDWDKAARHFEAARAIDPSAEEVLAACLEFRQQDARGPQCAGAGYATGRGRHQSGLDCLLRGFAGAPRRTSAAGPELSGSGRARRSRLQPAGGSSRPPGHDAPAAQPELVFDRHPAVADPDSAFFDFDVGRDALACQALAHLSEGPLDQFVFGHSQQATDFDFALQFAAKRVGLVGGPFAGLELGLEAAVELVAGDGVRLADIGLGQALQIGLDPGQVVGLVGLLHEGAQKRPGQVGKLFHQVTDLGGQLGEGHPWPQAGQALEQLEYRS
ncbi:MAG: site-2 protease family protein [Candidatus Eremiobacteraeota bacterium]|nr:site-2 protease family protein [Candidatus Eremiobacteraeota bacterium]